MAASDAVSQKPIRDYAFVDLHHPTRRLILADVLVSEPPETGHLAFRL